MKIIKKGWCFDFDFLSLRISSNGFSIDFFTIYFLNDYRSLFNLEIYFNSIWTLDILYFKLIKD